MNVHFRTILVQKKFNILIGMNLIGCNMEDSLFIYSQWNSQVAISYRPLVFHQSKRIKTEIEKVQLLTLCNLLKIQEEKLGVD